MCSKGNPSTTQQQAQNTNQSGSTQGQQLQTGFSQLGPNPDTLALYNAFLQGVGGTAQTPFDTNMMPQTIPWTAGQDAASNYQMGLGMQGMPYGAQAAGMIAGGGGSTMGQIPGAAASIRSPYGEQAAGYGIAQGQRISDWGTSHGNAISDYAIDLAARGPQLQQFSQGAVDQYLSPYINDVVNATQGQFTNANAQQGNVLLGQGIKSGNAFGGDRAGVAAAQMANQQQLAQAPVIAGLYDKGYMQALGEYNTQNQLAAQLGQMAIQGQIAGGQLGLQGQTAGGQLGLQGFGMGLQDWNAANQQAIGALGQNQNAAIQGGQGLGQLGALQYSQNLAGGAQANQAAQIYPAYLQQLYGQQASNAQMAQAYPFQTSSWYGGLLQGIGGLTGTQQQNVNAALANYLTNQQGTSLINGVTTPPEQNSWLQAAGLGIAGLGLLAKRGGSVPRMPHRAMGGGIPRYAAGGPAGRPPGPGGLDLNFLTGGFGDTIQPRALQATHLAAPNTAATDIKLPVLSTLTFPGMSQPSASTGTQGSQSTLGQAGALLGNKQVQSGLKGIGGMLFGNNDVSVAALGGGSGVGTEPSGGPNPFFRRGGTVAMRHYPSGGFVPDPYADNPDVESANDFAWIEDMFKDPPKVDPVPSPYADDPEQVDDQPQPQPSVEADENLPAGWTAPEDSSETPMPQPGPEPRDDFVPDPYADELAQPDDQPQPMTPEALGQPEPQAGIGPERGGGRGGRGRGRPERINFPGQGGAPQGFLSRWASNPLTQFGLGLASAKGAGLTGVAEGLNMGLSRVQAQQIANDKLDKNYKLDTSGDTTRLIFPTHAIDTKLPTGRARLAQQQRMGRIPAGMMMNDAGVLVPMPVEEGQKAPALRRTAEAPAAAIPQPGVTPPQPEVKVAEEDETAIPAMARLTQGQVVPKVDVPDPPAVRTADGDVSPQAIKIASENYLQRGKFPPGMFRDKALRNAIMNHAAIIAESRGTTPQEAAEMWRFADKQASWLFGQDGRQAGSLGTVIDHLDTLRDLTTALNNGDIQILNSVKNKWAKLTGKSYPTDVETAAPIVAAEILKAVGIAGAGTGGERVDAGLHIGDLSKSPAQFAGSIEAAQRLAAGQLNTKRRTAAALQLNPARFETLVGKRAMQIIDSLPESEAGRDAKTTGAPAAAPAVKPPEVGEVRKGYRFNGGDPGAPTSWEKVDQL